MPSTAHLVRPGTANQKFMWNLISELFPRYRALCGPDYRESLRLIADMLPLELTNVASTSVVNGWKVPREFSVVEAWVADSAGRRIIDYAEHPYHLKIYSQPFDGTVDYETLLSKISVSEEQPQAIPLRQCYYVEDWGFCATKAQINSLVPGQEYRVVINTRHEDGQLTVGEHYLAGASNKEIIFTAYLCHPRGANDNLSGVVVAVELMRLLATLPTRAFSYRLLLNPETIGSLAWIHSEPQRLTNVIGGYEVSICGDPSPIRYFGSLEGNALVDRAGVYALNASGLPATQVPYSFVDSGCDQSQFNAPGVRVPFGRWSRAGASNYAAYHTSDDDLNLVRPEALFEALTVVWRAVMAIERCSVYKPRYVGLPFLSGLGVYPYRHYSGDGSVQLGAIARAYYELLGFADGHRDMIEIAMRTSLPIEAFDEPLADFLRVGLIEQTARPFER